ncbi:MAG: hypothetical protein ACOVN0_18665 [Niveispirillum sp.]|uniref:hypothetical protein n=1 Tax=Niveispirillum sp. TaxID=1917217 RepID=UPI003BA5462D
MGKRLGLAAMAGAFILFFWGFFWFGISPMAKQTLQPLPEGAQPGISAMAASGLSSGTYISPAYDDSTPEIAAKTIADYAAGPVVMIHYRNSGIGFMDPVVMLTGLIHFFVSALIVGWLSVMSGAPLPTFRARWLVVAVSGILIGFAGRFSQPIWYQMPWDFFLYYAAFDVTGWALAGLAMARILRPAK